MSAVAKRVIAANLSGAELAALVVAEAKRRGLTCEQFAADLSRWPTKWLAQLRAAQRPKPETVARVHALLAGEPVPPPPVNNFQSTAGGTSYRPAPGSWKQGPAAPLPPRVDRDPCLRCGVRGDIGCRHRRRYE